MPDAILEERLRSSDLARIGGGALDGLVADAAWLEVHLSIPSIDILDSALRNACRELNAKKGNWYRSLVFYW